MSRAFLALAIVTAGLAGLTAGAGASGGPAPGISNGWDGIVAPGGIVR